MVRVLTWAPVAQDWLHWPQSDHEDWTQSTGHAALLHDRDSATLGHATPPDPALVVIVRERDCSPEAHDVVHALQVLHELYTQSTGHESLPHVRLALSAGHSSPLCCMATSTLRVWVCEPPPQVRVHSVQALHAETSQSIGQGVTAQVFDCVRSPHEVPPLAAGVVSVRERVEAPEPQVVEQSLHEPQAEATQSTGQAALLHVSASTSWLHATPPNAAALAMLRVRFLLPPLHVAVQAPNDDHVVIVQSSGHD